MNEIIDLIAVVLGVAAVLVVTVCIIARAHRRTIIEVIRTMLPESIAEKWKNKE